MPNITSILKSEIARVARKEIRAEVDSLKKASAQYRSSIAGLNREMVALEKRIKQLSKGAGRQTRDIPEAEPAGKRRFSAKRLATHRAKLGLSADTYGALIGVSGQSIYKWEAEKARPRQSQLNALASIRGIGTKEAAAKLEELQR